MKQVINGLTYNTDTADFVCCADNSLSTSDFGFVRANVYRTKKGRFFLAGRGGARSPFSRRVELNGYCGGEGIIPLSHDDARLYAEEARMAPEDMARFFTIEEA